mmetsp:Transcript_86587/g.149845  ORF Transcript_86587/g.149845 Transcript_86587/m.149845 type:complete len:600 (+) Transcript_86587:88-1887(+)
MKFGKNIGGQQSENSDFHYIEYKLLKKKIKDVVECQESNNMADALSANTSFEQELSSEINQVNTCFERRQKDLLVRIASLSEELQVRGKSGSIGSLPWPPSQESTEPVVVGRSADAAAGVSLQWPEAFAQLCDMLKEVDRLRKYAVWNALGVVKILKKRRKQTSFGLEDVCSERAGWLSRQSFFSGSEFAELHAAVESIGHALVLSELAPGSQPFACSNLEKQQLERQPQQCPICLDLITDMVELDCKHRFCWKCFVLGPIAFQPGEYRIAQCPICRRETSTPQLASESSPSIAPFSLGANIANSDGMLTRFLHTYYPQGAQSLLDAEAASLDGSEGGMDAVGDLVRVVLADRALQEPSSKAAGSESGSPVSQQKQQMQAAQKLQWLQLASEHDPFAIDSTMYCTLCSEPLLMEEVVTTPCKHHFHRICVNRLETPQCPLCSSGLPFSWFLPADHPLAEKGFKVVPIADYRPQYPGGPSRGCCGFPLHQPPPIDLRGPDGLVMKSYVHRIPPMGNVSDYGDSKQLRGKAETVSLQSLLASEEMQSAEDELEPSSASESSSEDSSSEVDEAKAEERRSSPKHSRSNKWAYTAVGRMRVWF